MQDFRLAVWIDVELINRRALGAERAFVVRAARIALDVDDAVALHVHQRRASDGAERTDARHRLGVLDAERLRLGARRRERRSQSDQSADCGPGARAGGDSQEITTTDLHGALPCRDRYRSNYLDVVIVGARASRPG